MSNTYNTLPEHPIGIFDSGIGGLTVAQAVVNQLPNENIIYFGDTAHLPYGDKSTATLQTYALKIADWLQKAKCKLILMACHSASAAAFEVLQKKLGDEILIINVIDPVIHLLQQDYAGKKIGLIGTRQTVNSNIYKQKIEKLNAGITFSAHATNLLAAAIEEFGNHPAIDGLLKEYLSHPHLHNIDALILGCTHYPILKDKIWQHFNEEIDMIDSALSAANAVKKALAEKQLLNEKPRDFLKFHVSDYTETFALNANLFFDQPISLNHYPLWD